MKLTFVCLCLLSLLVGLALWHQALLQDLTEQTEALLHAALLSAEEGEWQSAVGLLDEAVSVWHARQKTLQVFGDHGIESQLNDSLTRAAAYAKQGSAPLFFGEAASLFRLLEEIVQADRPVLGNILRGFVGFPV